MRRPRPAVPAAGLRVRPGPAPPRGTATGPGDGAGLAGDRHIPGKAPAGAWAGPGDDCDAAIAPVVTGRVDHDLLNQLAGRLASHWAEYQPGRAPCDGGRAAATSLTQTQTTISRRGGDGTWPPPVS